MICLIFAIRIQRLRNRLTTQPCVMKCATTLILGKDQTVSRALRTFTRKDWCRTFNKLYSFMKITNYSPTQLNVNETCYCQKKL